MGLRLPPLGPALESRTNPANPTGMGWGEGCVPGVGQRIPWCWPWSLARGMLCSHPALG